MRTSREDRRGRRTTPLRLLTAAAASATLLGTLGATGSWAATSRASKVSLTWWTWTGNPQAVIKNFEKHYPNISVTYKDLGGGSTEYTKLDTVLAAGSGAPDVAQIEYDVLPQFIATNKLVDIAKYVDKYKKDYPKWVWDQVSRGGDVYAVPEDIGPMALIYEPAIFKKYGLGVPKTWAQYQQDAVKLHKADPSEYMALNPAAPMNGGELIAMFWQAGADIFKLQSGTTWDVAINTPTTRKVLSYWVQLAKNNMTSLTTAYSVSDYHNIAQAKYASFVAAAWYPGIINPYVTKKVPQEFAVAPLPQWKAGESASANNGGSTNAVTSQAPDPQAAAEFAAFINTSSSGIDIDASPYVSGGNGRGLFPAASARAKASGFDSPIPNFAANTNQVFSQSAGNVNVGFEWSPWTQDLENALSVDAYDAAQGKMSVSAALAKVQSTVVTDAQQAGYTVKVLSH